MQDRYYRFSKYLRERFSCRVKKISIDAGFSCPNRDGKLSTGGCIYCDNRGFSMNSRVEPRPLQVQISDGIKGSKRSGKAEKFIIYFQAYTNTYAPTQILRQKYDTIKQFDDVVAIAIGTRPDCVNKEILELINSYSDEYEVWIEYGLQSIHDKTLKIINRGHSFKDFLNAVSLTRLYPKIKICVHVIIGLPGETKEDMIMTARIIADLNMEGVKIHPLHVIKGTKLEEMFNNGSFKPLEINEYINLVASFIENLAPSTVIQRISADCPPDLLIAPKWLHEKVKVLKSIDDYLEKSGIFQGKQYHPQS